MSISRSVWWWVKYKLISLHFHKHKLLQNSSLKRHSRVKFSFWDSLPGRVIRNSNTQSEKRFMQEHFSDWQFLLNPSSKSTFLRRESFLKMLHIIKSCSASHQVSFYGHNFWSNYKRYTLPLKQGSKVKFSFLIHSLSNR